jgi:hypothetical protein
VNRRLLLAALSGVSAGDTTGIVLTDQSITDVGGQSAVDATVRYQLQTNGIARKGNNFTGLVVIPGQWTSPTAAVGADYEVRAEVVNADPPFAVPTGDAVAQWLSLGTTRTWNVTAGISRITILLLVTIRRANDQVEVASANIFFDAQRLDL